jgi:hypothetical protein
MTTERLISGKYYLLPFLHRRLRQMFRYRGSLGELRAHPMVRTQQVAPIHAYPGRGYFIATLLAMTMTYAFIASEAKQSQPKDTVPSVSFTPPSSDSISATGRSQRPIAHNLRSALDRPRDTAAAGGMRRVLGPSRLLVDGRSA